MKNLQISSLAGDLSSLSNVKAEDLENVKKELENGVDDKTAELISFKVEQKISNVESSNQLNIGGFVNANSRFKSFKTRYLATLLSNKKENLQDPDGNVIATKQYGIGLGLVLSVKDIETKVNGNYGVLAASAKLDFSTVDYKLEVYGVTDATVLANIPNTTGEFSSEAFKKLSEFISSAKAVLKNPETSKLFPIEVINEEDLTLEKSDWKSIYYGVRRIYYRSSLYNAIMDLRGLNESLNENVVQFVYKYFGLKDAYAVPSETQKQNASKWLDAKYNKIDNGLNDDSWVSIDGSFTGETGDPNLNYKPHPKPADWSNLAKKFEDEFSQISAEFSSELKIAAIADVDSDFNSIVISRDIALYLNTSADRPENSRVIETRYGVGIRFMVKLSSIEFGTDVNFATIGAVSDLNLANVEYSISGIGFASKDMLDELPGPQNISQGTIDDLNNSLNDIAKKIAQIDADDLNPQPYKIRVLEPDQVDPTLEAQAYVFSARQITKKVRLNDTLTIGRKAGLSEDHIQAAYREYGITNNDRITNTQRDEAREWLHFD